MAFDMSMIGRLLGGLGGLGTTGMGAYNAFGGGYKDPTKNASNTIGQIPGQVSPYYQPYMDAGKGALGDIQNQYQDLFGGKTYDKLASGYKESPGYKFKLDQAIQGANNAQAAGGMLGTPQHQQVNMETAEGIASKDFQDYMNSQMGLYNTGMNAAQGINNMGYGASDSMANTLANSMGQQGQMQFYGDAGKNMWKNQGMNNIFSGLGQAGGSLMGGDFLKQLMSMFGQSSGGA